MHSQLLSARSAGYIRRALIRDFLESELRAAVERLIASGELPPGDYPTPTLSDAKDASHGDFSSQFALAASKTAGLPPREIADRLAAQLPLGELLDSAEVAGPGFLNLRLKPAAIAKFVKEVLEKGDDLPRSVAEAPVRLNVEFVSVNPNGPITVGSGRGAAFGSTLCNVLEAAGHKVHREYYINDGTNSEQMRLFAESVRAILLDRPLPEGGYRGDYVAQISERVKHQIEVAEPSIRRLEFRLTQMKAVLEKAYIVSEESRITYETQRLLSALRPIARMKACGNRNEDIVEGQIAAIQVLAGNAAFYEQADDLEDFDVTFDTWFSEQFLHDSGKVEECIDALIAKGAADTEPYQLEVIKKKGEPDEVKRNEQPVEEEDADQANESFEPSPPTPSPSSPGGEKGEGAIATLWLRSTKFADDKDRVLRRKDGRWTYIASDVAYHKDKFNRGSAPGEKGSVAPADKLLTILGPDHHGYIGRLRAVVAALLEEQGEAAGGDATQPLSESEALLYRDPAERDACLAALEEARKKLEVVIFQIVRFVKDGKPAPMRKRDGNIYSLKDLMLEIGKNAAPAAKESEQLRIGKDVARFFYLMRSHDTHMDFDLDLAEKQSDENPVYYVQYAHARICSVLRKAEETGLGAPGPHDPFDPALLAEPKELALIKKVCDLPFEVRRCAEDYGVHRLTSYATELARAYHAFYDSCRVLQPENLPLTRARLALCQAAAIGLRSTLGLLGISAPERM
ncbi:MAG: Arginine--tRNA ligase [Fimbriimonadaceae bacterium]|nr:Arginine--tRNA ligase [Fimbriimonadaceae bacterium]